MSGDKKLAFLREFDKMEVETPWALINRSREERAVTLFQEGKIGSMTLPNRIIRSATQDPFGHRDGTAAKEQVQIYGDLAASGVGLIISAYANVPADGRATKIQVGFSSEAQYESQKEVLDAVHAKGGKLVLQIHHAGENVFFVPESGLGPLAPTGSRAAANKLATREITEADMDRIAGDFVTAAVKAKELGFDGVQLHCAHGYLLNQFMDPNYNQRTDEHGGSAENRFRFTARIMKDLRAAVGADYPILIKINANCAGEADAQYAEDFVYFCQQLEALGADAIEVSGFDWIAKGKAKEHNYYLARISKAMETVKIPFIMVGGMRTQEDLKAVEEAKIPFFSFSRPFIAQPDLVSRLKNGEDMTCISCSKCFILWEKEGRRCVLHPKPEA